MVADTTIHVQGQTQNKILVEHCLGDHGTKWIAINIGDRGCDGHLRLVFFSGARFELQAMAEAIIEAMEAGPEFEKYIALSDEERTENDAHLHNHDGPMAARESGQAAGRADQAQDEDREATGKQG